MECTAQSRWLQVPQTVKASRHLEENEQSETPGLQGEAQPELWESNSHICATEEAKFECRCKVQTVD